MSWRNISKLLAPVWPRLRQSYNSTRSMSNDSNGSEIVPKVVLNNLCEIPLVGLGTWSATKDFAVIETIDVGNVDDKGKVQPADVAKIVSSAIDIGYRLIDCAYLYKNEKEIGAALQEKIQSKKVKSLQVEGVLTPSREDIFISTKLWNTFHNPDNVCKGLKLSLDALCLDYIDLYFMHSPMAYKAGEDLFPVENGKPAIAKVDFVDTWLAMEKLVKEGFCKSIGISNFNAQQIERLVKKATIIPQILQVELHPYLTQKNLIACALHHGINIMAFASLGSPQRPWAGKDTPRNLLDDPKVTEIAKKHKKSNAQILLRYAVQNCYCTIPKAVNKEQLCENLNLFNFELCPEDMQNLESLNHDFRFFQFTGASGHPDHPFESNK